MKSIARRVLVVALLVLGTQAVFAQSKKKLRAENAQLKQEKTELQKANIQLDRERQSLKKQNQALKTQAGQLQSEVKRLQQNVTDLKATNNRLNTQIMEGGAGSKAGGADADEVAVDPNDKRPCALKQSTMTAGQSYYLTLNKMNFHGWGVQIYSYSSLCRALDKAAEFSGQYKMFNTYIRVKEVDGKRMFSVVYGSLKDESQARVYVENFRKIAQDEEGRNAFLIQH